LPNSIQMKVCTVILFQSIIVNVFLLQNYQSIHILLQQFLAAVSDIRKQLPKSSFHLDDASLSGFTPELNTNDDPSTCMYR
jgi:hypothetical protein